MKLKKELPIIIIVLIPFIYLAYNWSQIPETVPVHWNGKGEIDRYGDKIQLLLLPFLLPLLTYLIFLIVPKIDPKNKLSNMGNKLHSLKLILTTFMSVLALYLIYLSTNPQDNNPDYILLAIGVLFIILGNYFKTIKANYFIGIRTPWTLENETIWKKTHLLGGKMWFLGGLLIVISVFLLNSETLNIVFLTITGIICIVPVAYSYILYKKLK